MSKPRLPTQTLDHAKRLRKSMTDAERWLWQYLRAGRLEGMKFRRQHPVPPYIVDFCCVEACLVVELDGSQHTPAADAARTRYLQSQGWRVVRFCDNDVLREVEAVVTAIWDFASRPALSPTPLPPGEGL
ncbi:endonuclease domain-containing protein [Pseudoxanthomonas sp.]|uniref:endonuclease domain-containing protein n=1 Tax=Pseudoxanthomonas sp. TaxID=1871049 RepID=UPI0028C432F6|nr:endonuclease domain-containing protein [Pseudoxanthomonas sp.]